MQIARYQSPFYPLFNPGQSVVQRRILESDRHVLAEMLRDNIYEYGLDQGQEAKWSYVAGHTGGWTGSEAIYLLYKVQPQSGEGHSLLVTGLRPKRTWVSLELVILQGEIQNNLTFVSNLALYRLSEQSLP